jgi:hypothetical protein
MRLGVERPRARIRAGLGVEEQTHPHIGRAVAALHRGSKVQLVRAEDDTGLLTRLADHRRDRRLVLLGLTAGQVPHAIRETSTLPQPEQHLIAFSQQQEHVDHRTLSIRHGRRA